MRILVEVRCLELDEESIILILFTSPIPVLVFFFRFIPSYSWLVIVFYVVLGFLAPVYLTSRQQSVYAKAKLIAWLKLAGKANLSPKEREIIDKALGKSNKPIRIAKSKFRKYWKYIFVSLIALSSLTIALFPIPQSLEKTKYCNILVKDHFVNLVPFGGFNSSQILFLTLEVNSTESIYISSCKVKQGNNTLGISNINSYEYSDIDYLSITVYLKHPINDTIAVYFTIYPEKYSFNQTYTLEQLMD